MDLRSGNRMYFLYHAPCMVGMADVLRDWAWYSELLRGNSHLRNRAYWGAVAGILHYGGATLEMMATRRGWTVTEMSRWLVERRSAWY